MGDPPVDLGSRRHQKQFDVGRRQPEQLARPEAAVAGGTVGRHVADNGLVTHGDVRGGRMG